MNKKLMAVAVAGIFATPAVALAASSTVQIYGKLTYDYAHVDQGAGKPSVDIAQAPHGSAIGFKGEEKLGGGLSAWFQCETSADVTGTSDDNHFCSRNSAVGFKGGWGNLHFGRWDSPFKRALNMGWVGAKDTGSFGHSSIATGGSGGVSAIAASGRTRWKRRDVGWTYYESPKFNGFQLLAAVTPGNAATGATSFTTAAKPRVASLGGTYSMGPFGVGLGFERHYGFGSVGTANNDEAWTISGSYKFGKVKVGAWYLDAEYETSPVTETEKKNWMIGVDWAISGPHGLIAAYTSAGDSKGTLGSPAVAGTSGAGIAAVGPNTGGKMYSIMYRHTFSKRTVGHLGYSKLKNDLGSSYTLSGSKIAKAGEDMDALGFIIEHRF